MTSQPEIFNRNEDEEIDEEEDSRGGNQNYRHYQYMEQSDSQINHRAEDERRSSVGTIMDKTQQRNLMTQTMRNSN